MRENLIQEIHNSPLYGIVIETGCGAAITTELTNEPGASKTLYFSKVPYSKEYEEIQYGKFERSVSKDFVEKAAAVECSKLNAQELNKVNFIVVTSWQMATQPGSLSHGWYLLSTADLEFKHVLHFTFPKIWPIADDLRKRTELVKAIGELGAQLIHAMIQGNDGFADRVAEISTSAILDAHYTHDEIGAGPVKQLEKHIDDYFLAYGPGKQMIRFEELLRKGDSFLINKGSFNPLHHQHVEMMIHAAAKVPGCVPVFLISTYRWDKPHISWDELKPRIEAITNQGYYVIICKEVFFYNTFRMLKLQAGKNKKFYFTIGSDTLLRIWNTDLSEATGDGEHEPSPFVARTKIDGMKRIYSEQFKFIVFKRNGIELPAEINWYDSFLIWADSYEDDGTSSTLIRNGEAKNKLD